MSAKCTDMGVSGFHYDPAERHMIYKTLGKKPNTVYSDYENRVREQVNPCCTHNCSPCDSNIKIKTGRNTSLSGIESIVEHPG